MHINLKEYRGRGKRFHYLTRYAFDYISLSRAPRVKRHTITNLETREYYRNRYWARMLPNGSYIPYNVGVN